MKRFQNPFRSLFNSLTFGWKGALLGLILAAGLTWVWAAYHYFPAEPRWLSTMLWSAAGFLLAGFLGLALALMVWLLGRLPRLFLVVVTGSALLIGFSIWVSVAGVNSFLMRLALLIIGSTLLGSGVANLARNRDETTRKQRLIWISQLITGILLVAVYLLWLFMPGFSNPYYQNINASSLTLGSSHTIPDPSLPGTYQVEMLTYGSGQDRRPEYDEQADIVTPRVDGTAFITAWEAQRTRYWGFDQTSLPLNGRIFYPQGDGSYPLVLLIHGNHPMETRSELGFDYLCELFASQGYICTSIDENFLNISSATLLNSLFGSSIQTPIGDNQARAWLALEHLKLFRHWEGDPNSPFFHKIDLDQIALIGHSMGGEAVAIASVFNKMPYFYDAGTVKFDYGFNIRTVIAIAPVDNIYTLGGNGIELENTNYLVLHGSTDSDVYSFLGLGQYERTKFSGGFAGLKSSLYIDKANHSQFNSQWGKFDLYIPAALFLNNAQTMDVEEQQQITKVYLSAFLDLTLKNRMEYLSLFIDPSSADAWLPDTIYLNQAQTSTFQPISTFEEDTNLLTTTLTGGQISQTGIVSWSERAVQGKIPQSSHDSNAVFLGWDEPGYYTITFPDSIRDIPAETLLAFVLADAAEDPRSRAPVDPERMAREPIDLTIELIDADGDTARLALSQYSYLQPQIRVLLGKTRTQTQIPASEIVPQTFFIPLLDFQGANPDFDPGLLTGIRFRFDRTPSGVIAIDNIGLQLPAVSFAEQ